MGLATVGCGGSEKSGTTGDTDGSVTSGGLTATGSSAGNPMTGGSTTGSTAASSSAAGATTSGAANSTASGPTSNGSGGASAGSTSADSGGSGGSGDSGGSGGNGGSGDVGGSGGSETTSDGSATTTEGSSTSGGGSGGEATDVFGIEELYPSAPGGGLWSSEHWGAGDAYDITSRTDENDPLEISGMRGTGTLEVTGDGELVMGGSQPRIYIYPSDAGPWRDIEVTVYYQRVDDAATGYAGLVVGARSGPEGHGDDPCDAHTYYSRLRHDGATDFEKELQHSPSSTRSRVDPEEVWPPDGDLPFDTWIGWKYVIYNLPDGEGVKLESYRDMTEGEDGGNWELLNETVDDGGWFVDTDCDEHDPEGGESDMIQLEGGTTFIRNTDVTEARYKWVTVREIAP
ncbi:MAG TPA: hypothetical protein VI197_07040 [Polyangiaceae bacterium]